MIFKFYDEGHNDLFASNYSLIFCKYFWTDHLSTFIIGLNNLVNL